ncbi:MAG: hypothetical protein KF795_14635 [Labilithrix sp.]|nr:hypothetical protein [Labilithrix sp.]
MAGSRLLLVCAAFGTCTVVSALLGACATVAELDVTYASSDFSEDSGSDASGVDDASRTVRESSVEPVDAQAPTSAASDLGPCDGGLGESSGCDDTAGLGCCLGKDEAVCIELVEAPVRCKGDVFVACRQSRGDDMCCWRTTANGRIAAYAADCKGGAIACLDSAGCPDGVTCLTKSCGVANPFLIGECGRTPTCPEEL